VSRVSPEVPWLLRLESSRRRALARDARKYPDSFDLDREGFYSRETRRAGTMHLQGFLFLQEGLLQPAKRIVARRLQASLLFDLLAVHLDAGDEIGDLIRRQFLRFFDHFQDAQL